MIGVSNPKPAVVKVLHKILANPYLLGDLLIGVSRDMTMTTVHLADTASDAQQTIADTAIEQWDTLPVHADGLACIADIAEPRFVYVVLRNTGLYAWGDAPTQNGQARIDLFEPETGDYDIYICRAVAPYNSGFNTISVGDYGTN